jgi:hypothetical protein
MVFNTIHWQGINTAIATIEYQHKEDNNKEKLEL